MQASARRGQGRKTLAGLARKHVEPLRLVQPHALPNATASSFFFNTIKYFRRIAARYEKHAANYFAMLKLVSTSSG
jgi:transposase